MAKKFYLIGTSIIKSILTNRYQINDSPVPFVAGEPGEDVPGEACHEEGVES